MTNVTRARFLGAALLLAVFASGVLAGIAYAQRRQNGVNVNVRLSTALPRELRGLGLSPSQERELEAILLDGQQHSLAIMHEFEPRLRAAMDSVNIRIHAVLRPEQRASFDAARGSRTRDVLKRELDTVRR
jgi:hypothetical protein